MLKKIGKIVFGGLLLLLVLAGILYAMYNEPLPKGTRAKMQMSWP